MSNRIRTNTVDNIICSIRNGILNSIRNSDIPNHDPWDEDANGAGWCDNELSLFNDLYHHINLEYILPNYTNVRTVNEINNILWNQTNNYLQCCLLYVSNGGTSNHRFFDWRDNRNTNEISNFFNQ